MTKKKNKSSSQMRIFDWIRQVSHRQEEAGDSSRDAGKYNIDVRLRQLLSSALKRCPHSHYEVAGRMSELLGVSISKEQLDSWTAESKENHRFPFAYAAAFCVATNDKSIVRSLAELCGGFFIEGEDALYTELGRIEQLKEERAKKERLVRETLEQLGSRKP